jgi:cell wall integrity and stress response component
MKPTSSSTHSSSGKSSSSAGGIAAGVIVAVLVVSAIFGGVFFYFRRRRQQESEAEGFKPQKDMKDISFGSSPASAMPINQDRPQMWAPDSRMDSGTATHRMSSGSIADNQDFSRRILQVRHAFASLQ